MATEPQVIEKEEQVEEREAMQAGFAEADADAKKPAAETQKAPEKSDAEREAEAKAQTEAKAKADTEAAAKAEQDAYDALPKALKDKLKTIDSLQGTVNKLAGNIGGLTNATTRIEAALKAAKSTAEKTGGDSPSDKQVQAALSNPEAFKRLKEDFPEWAEPIEAEFAALRAEIAKKPASPAVDVDGLRKEVTGSTREALDKGLAQAEERAYLRMKFPEWKATINSQECKTWILEGGPSLEGFQKYREAEQADPQAAREILHGFAQTYPKWWGDKGAFFFSESADDAVKLLEGYSEHRKQTQDAEALRLKKERRLESAVVPRGATPTGIRNTSDREAMQEGFASVDKT